jgi:hypothetical protein
MPSVIKSQLIELVNQGGSTATKLQFQDQPYLRQKQITGIEILNVNDMSASPTNKSVITNAQMQKSYLTLYLNDPGNPQNVGEWIQNVPLTLLHRVQNSSNDPYVRKAYDLVGQVIYWEKCYLSFSSSLANVADVSFLFNIYFKG